MSQKILNQASEVMSKIELLRIEILQQMPDKQDQILLKMLTAGHVAMRDLFREATLAPMREEERTK